MRDLWTIPKEDLEKLKDEHIVLGMSGGKDSTACALLLEKNGIKFDRVFMDTGWEHPALYDYIKDVLEPRFGKVHILRSHLYPDGLEQMIRKKGFFPTHNRRFCTKELKLYPLKKYIRAIDDSVISVAGIRKEESPKRSRMSKWEFDKGLLVDVFRPLLDYSFDDIIRMHQEADIAPNPLYLQGAERVGCFPCIFARKSEIDQVSRLWPERIDQIEKLEADLRSDFANRLATDEELAKKMHVDFSRRAAFLNTLDGKYTWAQFKLFEDGKLSIEEDSKSLYEAEYVRIFNLADKDKQYAAVKEKAHQIYFFDQRSGAGIREVVAWSKTTRGGKQIKMFDATANDGCTRWGMCESPLASSDLVKISEGRNESKEH